MMQGFQPDSDNYQSHIIFVAYGTAFITVGLIVFLYYQVGNLLTISNRFLKALILAAIMLEIKGDLFRQPFMDYLYNVSLGLQRPLEFVMLNQADKWIANLFLALCLVYFCPTKQRTRNT